MREGDTGGSGRETWPEEELPTMVRPGMGDGESSPAD